MKDDSNLVTVFRRVRGRIVPIKVSRQEKEKSRPKAVVATAAGLGGAYAAGRLGPTRGFASAGARIRKTMKFKAAKFGGIAFLLGSAVAADNAVKATGYDDPTDGILPATAMAFMGRKLARFGKARQLNVLLKKSLNYSKLIPGI